MYLLSDINIIVVVLFVEIRLSSLSYIAAGPWNASSPCINRVVVVQLPGPEVFGRVIVVVDPVIDDAAANHAMLLLLFRG